jgi:hypothetical protein
MEKDGSSANGIGKIGYPNPSPINKKKKKNKKLHRDSILPSHCNHEENKQQMLLRMREKESFTLLGGT